MTGCRNPAHYPNREAMLSDDMHLHCAGRVEVMGGDTYVFDATHCELPCDVCHIVRPSPQMGYCYTCRRERCFACKDEGHDARCAAEDGINR